MQMDEDTEDLVPPTPRGEITLHTQGTQLAGSKLRKSRIQKTMHSCMEYLKKTHLPNHALVDSI